MVKLYKKGTTDNGETIRLQSQLYVGTNTADFILENNVLKVWSNQPNKGFDFHETNIPYTIVENIKEMEKQPL